MGACRANDNSSAKEVVKETNLCQLYRLGIIFTNNGSVKPYFLILIAAFWLLMHTPSRAQKPKRNFKKNGVVQLNDSLTSYSQSDIFVFPNVNKIKYYTDQAKLDRNKKKGPAGDEEQKNTE